MSYSRENLQNNPILNPPQLEQLLGSCRFLGVHCIIITASTWSVCSLLPQDYPFILFLECYGLTITRRTKFYHNSGFQCGHILIKNSLKENPYALWENIYVHKNMLPASLNSQLLLVILGLIHVVR